MSDKIELIRLCGVLQSNFLFISQSESRTQPCHVRIVFYRQPGLVLNKWRKCVIIFTCIL